jgi:ABC-2 type transport system ATP-binding protein
MDIVIDVKDLTKIYGSTLAVDRISFQVMKGEIFGMVGPNGAGKTTTIECIEGLRQPDDGAVTIFNKSPIANRMEITEQIGIQLQESGLPARLKVGEALSLFASFYEENADVDELLDLMGLSEKRGTAFTKLSGGQKQRLFIALALINKPKVVFFDELTTGLDPQARRRMWDLVRQIREQGATVFLTTHYMEEAERLCDRVLIIDDGIVVALDTPEALIRSLGVEKRLVFKVPDDSIVPPLVDIPLVSRVEKIGDRIVVYGHGDRFASTVVRAMEDSDLDFLDLRTEQPTLEDVFLNLTGREMRE